MKTIAFILLIASPAGANCYKRTALLMSTPTQAADCSAGTVGVDVSSGVLTEWRVNLSTRTMIVGEIVVSANGAVGFDFTTAAATTTILGVVYGAPIPAGSSGEIAYAGVVLVKNGSAVSPRGRYIQSSASSGQTQSTAAPAAYTAIGRWHDNCAANALCWGILR